MKKFLLAASAAAAALVVAPAANAASFVVTVPGITPIPGAPPAVNDFKTQLNGLGLVNEAISANVSISGLSGAGIITFEFLGSDSAYSDSFSYDGTLLFSENSFKTNWGQGGPAKDVNVFGNGAFLALFQAIGANAVDATPGTAGFTVFLPTGYGAGDTYESNVIYFGYDDIPNTLPGNPLSDDNHDDMIIRATIRAVPEPTTWALMVAGIAAVGMSMRRRSQNVRVAFS